LFKLNFVGILLQKSRSYMTLAVRDRLTAWREQKINWFIVDPQFIAIFSPPFVGHSN
jgi:hypothetical protein